MFRPSRPDLSEIPKLTNFITAVTIVRLLPLSCATSIQSILPFNFLKIYVNISFPSTTGSSKWFLSLGYPHSSVPHTCYTLRPYHSSWSDGPSNICELYTLCSSSQPSIFPCYLVPRKPKYLPQHLFLNTASLCSSSM